MHPNTDAARLEQLITTMTARMTRIAGRLGAWV